MPADFLPVLILLLFAAFFACLALLVPAILGPRKPTPLKSSTYECGKEPFGDAHRRFRVNYYLVAMLFLIFDLEVIFLYPWAVLYRKFTPVWFSLIEAGAFVLVLLVGYLYVWRKGALNWD